MRYLIAPTFEAYFGDYWLLWFASANRYSVVTTAFKSLLDLFLDSDSALDFKSQLDTEEEDANTLVERLQHYLNDCNAVLSATEADKAVLDRSTDPILKHYKLHSKTVAVYYDSEAVLSIIHPAIAHLSVPTSDKAIDTSFDIYIENDSLCLFKDAQLLRRVPKMDYHHIQGKFIMHLLCTFHNKVETDWIGTFHGSTITDGNAAVLFVGQSGKGKSTLCALLAAHGFDLLADDLSPMLSKNQCIYHNPLALSIKKGSFEVLQPHIPHFKDLPTVNSNKSKGQMTYVPCAYPKKTHYPCKAIILVNYIPKAATQLQEINIKTALETLIPESWLSPNPLHAKQFMAWLETVEFYQLSYSDTQSVTQEVSSLFKAFQKPL